MNWGIEDFIAATCLLGGAALAIAISLRVLHRPKTRLLAIGAVLLVLVLIWAELAVGIFH